MRTRILLAVTAVAASALPVAATASATTGSCAHLLSDPRGNAKEWFVPGSPYNADADLLSVDAATTAKTIDFTVTLAKVEPAPTTGTDVSIYFTSDHQGTLADFSVNISHAIDGDSFGLENSDTLAVWPIAGSTNTKAGTFTLHVPRSLILATYRGAVLSQLGVIASQQLGVTEANGGFIEQSTGPGYHYVAGNINNCRAR